MKFGVYLRELREQKGMSIAKLAMITGYDRKQLHEYEKRHSYVPTNEKIVFDLSDALELTEEEKKKLLALAFSPRMKALEESFPSILCKASS